MVMAGGKYKILLVANHRLYPPKLESKEEWHNRIYMATKGIFTYLNYNTHNRDNITWNQYSGTVVTLTTNIESGMGSKGVDPIKLRRWTWVQIKGMAGEAIIIVSIY